MSIFIGMDERVSFRQSVKELMGYRQRLEKHLLGKQQLTTGLAHALEGFTGSTDPQAQLRAMEEMYHQIDAAYDAQLLAAASHSLSHFCEYMSRDEPPAHHHEFLIEHMEGVHEKRLMRLMISMPPGAAKSTYASVRFPAWHLGRKPNDRWLQGAHTQSFAKDRLGKPVRSVINEDRYKRVFDDMILSSESSAADYFEFAHSRGYYKAVGVGVGISGFRAEIGAIDDPIKSREDAESETARRKLHEWFEDDFGTRPMPGSPIYIVNTRWHEDDLSGHLLAKDLEGSGEGWEVINIPALAVEDDVLGRSEGEGLWPEVFGTAFYLAKKKGLTGRSWNSLYQGNPTDEEGGILKKADVQRYTNVPADRVVHGRTVKKIIKKITLSVDCAEKATQRSDYTAATVWIETFDKKHYLVHAARIRAEFNAIVTWIDDLARSWDVNAILVEDRGAGTQYIQVRQEHPGPAPVIAIATKQQSKEFRFDGVTPMFAAGEVFLPEVGTDWIADVEQQMFSFPNGRYDDYVDSVSQYLARAREYSGQRRGVKKIRSGQSAR